MGRSQSPASVERPVRWREPVVKFNDLPEHQKSVVISVTSEAYRRHVDFGKIAVAIKKGLDKTCSPGTWQVIIGKNMGLSCCLESENLIYFHIGPIGFMIFKNSSVSKK